MGTTYTISTSLRMNSEEATHYICESMHCESNQYQIVALQLQHQWLPFHISYCIVTLGLMMKHKKIML